MGSTSEHEYINKLEKIREKTRKQERKIRDHFEKIERIKVDSLKENEEMKRTAFKNIDKIEKNIRKSKDLAPESNSRLHSKISNLRREVESKNVKLKTKISETMIPIYTQQLQY